jgi:hypothetical protein
MIVLYILGFMLLGCVVAAAVAMFRDIKRQRKPYLVEYGFRFLGKKEGAKTDG